MKIKTLLIQIKEFNYDEFFNTINKIYNKYDIGRIYLFFDIIISKIKYKSTYKDYYLFSMYLLNKKERKTIITTGKNKEYIKRFNTKEYIHIFENKNELYEAFNKYLKRKWMFLNRKNFKDFNNFIKNMQQIIAKPNCDCNGNKIELININEYNNPRDLYKYLTKKDLLIVEEVIVQHRELNHLYDKSVNTIKINTLLYNNQVNIISMHLCIGNNNFIDCMDRGGMITKIDVEKGTTLYPACDRELNNYYFHPITKEKINYFKIPYIKEIIDLINKLCLIEQEIKYVTWDIVITNRGPILLEASPYPNNYCQFYIHNEDNCGLVPIIEKIIKDKGAVDSIEIKKDEELPISN